MIVCCRRCGNVMSLDSDNMYHCPNCDAVMPAWSVPQPALQTVEVEKKEYRFGDPIPDWMID